MIAGPKRKSFTPEYKAEAVRLVLDQSRPVETVARELGIPGQTLGNWVRAAKAAQVGKGPGEVAVKVRTLQEVERELREVRLENEFLKKAAAYFAKMPR
jgi:transposase